jgi:hypothetical protein
MSGKNHCVGPALPGEELCCHCHAPVCHLESDDEAERAKCIIAPPWEEVLEIWLLIEYREFDPEQDKPGIDAEFALAVA